MRVLFDKGYFDSFNASVEWLCQQTCVDYTLLSVASSCTMCVFHQSNQSNEANRRDKNNKATNIKDYDRAINRRVFLLGLPPALWSSSLLQQQIHSPIISIVHVVRRFCIAVAQTGRTPRRQRRRAQEQLQLLLE